MSRFVRCNKMVKTQDSTKETSERRRLLFPREDVLFLLPFASWIPYNMGWAGTALSVCFASGKCQVRTAAITVHCYRFSWFPTVTTGRHWIVWLQIVLYRLCFDVWWAPKETGFVSRQRRKILIFPIVFNPASRHTQHRRAIPQG
jgi:hypothetical protein